MKPESKSRGRSVPITAKIFWSVREVSELLGLGERTLWRWSAEGRFPRPRVVSRRRLWLAAEVKAWVKKQAVAK